MAKEIINNDLREAIERAFRDALDEAGRSRPNVDSFMEKLRSELVIKDRLGHDWRGARHV